jgi:hypothetical protein
MLGCVVGVAVARLVQPRRKTIARIDGRGVTRVVHGDTRTQIVGGR